MINSSSHEMLSLHTAVVENPREQELFEEVLEAVLCTGHVEN